MTQLHNIRSMFIGTLLGDAHIRSTAFAAYITFEQALIKKDYLYHLYSRVVEAGLGMNAPKQYDRNDPRYGTVNSSLYFRTVAHEELLELAGLFLDSSGDKVIPDNIAELLTLEALAYWICDDGQRVLRGGVTLCTDSFSLEEIQLLRDALKTNFGLNTTLHQKRNRKGELKYTRIYIGKPDLYSIRPQLKQFMHPFF